MSVIPAPRLRVDRFTNRPEQPKSRHFVLVWVLVAKRSDCPYRSWRSVELVHSPLFHDLPKTIWRRVGWNTLEHDRGCAVRQWSVDDVRVSGNPADIGSAEVNIPVVVVENVLVGLRGVNHVPTGGVLNTLWLPRRSRCVQNEQRIFSVHWFCFIHGIGISHYIVIPLVSTVLHVVFNTLATRDAFDDDAGFYRNAHLFFSSFH